MILVVIKISRDLGTHVILKRNCYHNILIFLKVIFWSNFSFHLSVYSKYWLRTTLITVLVLAYVPHLKADISHLWADCFLYPCWILIFPLSVTCSVIPNHFSLFICIWADNGFTEYSFWEEWILLICLKAI